MQNRNEYTQYRNSPQLGLLGMQPLIVDNFAGGGGASTGIELALGRDVDIAINHDETALSMHTVNHPHTRHFCESVWDVNPKEVTKGQPVGLAWFSPDCTHFSKAKGGKPVRKDIRGLARVAVRWAVQKAPTLIMLENVEEFTTWGPIKAGKPIKELAGLNFEILIKQLKHLDYQVEWKTLKAHDYGAPTIRKRLFLIARNDGEKIVWPKPTHTPRGKKGKNQRTAAECIDWSIPAPSIFERSKPLAENTCKRIAKGIFQYIINNPNPFTVNDQQAALITKMRNGNTGSDIQTPLHTITSGGTHHALTTAFLAKHYTGVTGSNLNNSIGTITSKDHHSLVSACMIPIDNTGSAHIPAHNINEPLRTITKENRHALVQAFLIKYYGTNVGQEISGPLHTITSKERFGLVTIHGEEYKIVDIGLRMLQPHELFKAQGFPANYIINKDSTGKRITKTKQNALCGNSVPPPVSQALVEANAPAELFKTVKLQEAA